MNLEKLLRNNIKALKPYSSARDEFSGEAEVFLDANENPYNAPYNRYPDPLQWTLKAKISEIKNVAPEKIFLGNGSDEPIDIVFRAFCEPGVDNVVSINPTYGMYQVAADINNVEVRKVKLDRDYNFKAQDLLNAANLYTKAIFICSPNNPTANLLDKTEINKLLTGFDGIVVVDEAYIDFSPESSLLPELDKYPNLIVLQTFSKAWGMAGIRLGMAFSQSEIIRVFNKIKYPYNINILTQQKALELLNNLQEKEEWVKTILDEREKLIVELTKFPFVQKVYPTDANFVLLKMHDARGIYEYLTEQKIIVRDRSKVTLCDDCLRITIGSPEENEKLRKALKELI
ncbi:MAG: histidinol-phosphate transaminase [Bacteroidetes bacterium GWF2_42_66]|nr:MAG: histidinol-phosphate transaminase [Bacteroidetes bacterium GWA2_42_15]OFY01370.1 MAG: histidinol-phosphate transaminase [Bacteroidetes bacterium GWE2_42_39]OFY42214.1 MAG: histidinol-phosphate transaminase [Bacteroidetes bacterium GWF2_42_66]HBL78017.1 histidinol-phosphate transaminase [Prolixibacteraceae bacterium]HCR89839.1 histidinol-phosphate transaminase [Prolixibacteraceae bacterium]